MKIGVNMVQSNVITIKNILLKVGIFDYVKKILIFKDLNRKINKTNENKTFLTNINNLHNFYTPSLKQTKGKQIKKLFENIRITIPSEGFIFTLDELKCLNYENRLIGNISIDYSKILNNSIEDLKLKYQNSNEFSENELETLNAIEILVNREIEALNISNHAQKEEYITYLNNIKNKKVTSFKEALQRILFFNQMLWQTNHRLNGLGRLDFILDEIYEKDNIPQEEAYILIKDFINKLHSHYYFKSSEMAGDTGQIIVLGGLNEDNTYFHNELTYLFIESLKELNLPDPKIILRYSKNIPQSLLELAIETMATGIGSPLLSNDDLVIEDLINFGYEKKDAYNYVVSACWEPAPIGRGLELNNVNLITFLKPLNELLDCDEVNYNTFDELFSEYKKYLNMHVNDILSQINAYTWETDPLISLFIENKINEDISKGSAIYNNYGLTSVSLSNTVNSLYNIKKLVFDEKKYSLNELNENRKNNFPNENLLNTLKNQEKFGMDNQEIISLTNEITKYVDSIFEKNTTRYGGKFKFGLSAPSYITSSRDISASLDGRKDFEPFNVHISYENNKDYTEVMRFASQLDYTNHRFNGNIVDFMVSPDFIKKNLEKFIDFIKISLNMGVFQIQLNVVSSEILIDAQKHPYKYPNLIVRVWGFSSYFNDLPKEYQDLLISRSRINEENN